MKMKVNEMVVYLKQNRGYKRIIEAILKKYKSLGKLSGFIILEELNDDEVKILSSYDYKVGETRYCKLQIKKFVENLCVGRFEGIDFEAVLKAYYGEPLMSNKEIKEYEERKANLFYKQLAEHLTSEIVKEWFLEVLETKKYGYQSINNLYKQQEEILREVIQAIDQAENYLSKEQEWTILPVLASKVTGDSHYFDLNKIEGKLLVYFLAYKYEEDYPNTLQATNALLSQAKILRDEVSNSTLCYGIYGRSKDGEKPWGAFWEIAEPLQLSISNIKDVMQISAMNSVVYIVENPAVFSRLLEKAVQKGVGLICTSGQINTSSYMILDLLEASQIKMYYNGDFDPEGLQIADKLKQRYKALQLWHYQVQDYLKVKGIVEIEDRLVKLNSIQSKEFATLIEVMKREKVAGYQELLVEELMESM